MAVKFFDRSKETASNKPNGATAFNLPDSGATGFRSFDSVLASNDVVAYAATNGTDWETGLGTFTAGAPDTLARTSILASSNSGSAVDFSGGGDVSVWIDFPAALATGSLMSQQSVTPGGRLTLTSGTPVTTSDVTGATTVYYTPHAHNIISLWDGYRWVPTEFAETSLALGTVTSGANYDVFGYLNAGALAIEKLIWTNDTTRATAITLQDGRYCKSGDKTRLYLGTIRSTSTTETEDSAGGSSSQVGGKRFVWNMYNRVKRHLAVIDTTDSWSYTTDTIRQAGGVAGNKVEYVAGLAEDAVFAQACGIVYITGNGTKAAKVGVGVDSTTAFSGHVQGGYNNGAIGLYAPITGTYRGNPGVGYHYLAWCEKGGDGTSTFLGDNAGDSQQAGMGAEVWA